jgi:hypothetical protein
MHRIAIYMDVYEHFNPKLRTSSRYTKVEFVMHVMRVGSLVFGENRKCARDGLS